VLFSFFPSKYTAIPVKLEAKVLATVTLVTPFVPSGPLTENSSLRLVLLNASPVMVLLDSRKKTF
jgi:hypothetical protein